MALACAALLPNAARRDVILRAAFASTLTQNPDAATRYLPQLLDRPWITDPGFFAILTFVSGLAEADPRNAGQLLGKAAQRYPALALREYRGYISLPFGTDVLERAAMNAPDEAVGLASGTSATAQGLLVLLRSSRRPVLQLLAQLATGPELSFIVRQRVAVFAGQISSGRLSLDQAIRAAGGPHYFSTLIKLRLEAPPGQTAMLDGVLEKYSEMLFRGMQDRTASPELAQLSAADVYLLLTYGRTEEDDALFDAIFDRLLMPKLRGTSLTKLLDQVHYLHLRRFLATAVAHHRLEAFLAADSVAEQDRVLARSIQHLGETGQPLADLLDAAEILNAIENPARLQSLETVVNAECARAGPDQPWYGLLAASLARKLPSLDGVAAKYTGYLHEPRILDAAGLFDHHGVSIQQYFFYDDSDGRESFESFQNAYARGSRLALGRPRLVRASRRHRRYGPPHRDFRQYSHAFPRTRKSPPCLNQTASRARPGSRHGSASRAYLVRGRIAPISDQLRQARLSRELPRIAECRRGARGFESSPGDCDPRHWHNFSERRPAESH